MYALSRIVLLAFGVFLSGAVASQANTQFQLKSTYGKGCPIEGWVKSRESNSHATIAFKNSTPNPLQLYWLNFQGKAQLHSTIQSGQWLSVKTFLTHMWFAKDPRKGECVGGIVKIDSSQMIRAFSPNQPAPTTKKPFNFPKQAATQNKSRKDALAKAFKDRNLKFPKQNNALTNAQKNALAKAFQNKATNQNKANNKSGNNCPWEGITKSPSSKFTSNVTFHNHTWEPLSIYWLNYQGRSQKFLNIQPGNSGSITSYVGHYWYAKDNKGKCYGKIRKVKMLSQSFDFRP